MDLAEAFRNHGEKIVKRWTEYTLSTYTSSGFFVRERDKFANPVGGNIREALGKLFLLLAKGADPKEFAQPLEQIIGIRAVQEFTPSQAVAPLNAVKHITREVFEADKERKHLVAELYDFEFAVDLALLAAFDIYMKYRERLYQVRINEIRSGSHILTDSKCPSKLVRKENKKVIK
ncbi:MAG: RsbRD N-terminal domain-containing protein [Desulforhopalus sp.]